jgi:hypothetical protein
MREFRRQQIGEVERLKVELAALREEIESLRREMRV